jgi:hypothetical protein
VNSNCEKVELFIDDEKIAEAIPDYENYNMVTFKNVEIKQGVLKAIGTKSGKTTENKVWMSGKPAKLTLKTSHNKINAGKNEMAIITADILDENNNRVIHANNVLNWEIEGEATLVGPAVYKNDFDLFESMEGTGYIRVPVSNVIRSENTPGKAKITVRSPGLESASVEINVVEPYDENSLIIQPKLDARGREKIRRIEDYKPVLNRVEELKKTSGNRTLNGNNEIEMRKLFMEFVLNENPEFDISLIESKVFLEWFTEYLINANGVLIGDDYNFKVDAYNDCRYISKAIDQSNLIFALASQLTKNYSEEIIVKGNSIDIETTSRLFLDLPKERLILRVSDEEGQPAPWISPKETRGTRSCVIDDFKTFVEFAYPVFSILTTNQKDEYFNYLEAINPELQQKNGTFNLKKGDQFCLPDPNGLSF